MLRSRNPSRPEHMGCGLSDLYSLLSELVLTSLVDLNWSSWNSMTPSSGRELVSHSDTDATSSSAFWTLMSSTAGLGIKSMIYLSLCTTNFSEVSCVLWTSTEKLLVILIPEFIWETGCAWGHCILWPNSRSYPCYRWTQGNSAYFSRGHGHSLLHLCTTLADLQSAAGII